MNSRGFNHLSVRLRAICRLNRRDFLRQSSLAGLGLAGCSIPGLSWAVRGTELHIRNYMDISSLDPPFEISGAEGVVASAIFQNLLQFKSNGTWDTKLDAAEYFEQLDDTHFAFRLKPHQMFSSGFGEMTAQDVKFSFERIIDPDLKAINAPDMGTLSHVCSDIFYKCFFTGLFYLCIVNVRLIIGFFF